MNKKQENLTYLVLFFISFGLLAYLVVDAATAYRGDDIALQPPPRPENDGSAEDNPEDVGNAIFEKRDLLFPIVTPEPTPTVLVLPTPTETPVPFMNKWELLAIIGNRIMFKDESGKVQHAKQGDVHFDVTIKEVNSREGYIVGEYKDGRTKRLDKNKL